MEDRVIGHSWGKRTVIRFARIKNGNERIYICRCECGSEDEVGLYSITAGRRSQCGSCRVRVTSEKNTKHGFSRDRTHKIWRGMIRRCSNSSDKDYERYGRRGISVDDKWLDFDTFLNEMGEAPEGTSIDRIAGGVSHYEPGNCRWATLKEQLDNRVCGTDLTGETFGRWKVVEYLEEKKPGRHYICKCECGNQGIVDASSLRAGKSTQCAICMYKNRVYTVKRGRKPRVT